MQRIQRFTTFDKTIKSARETLVNEFLEISTVTEHEFTNELARQRYARYIHAVGCLQYGDKFLADLEATYATGVVARPTFPVGESA